MSIPCYKCPKELCEFEHQIRESYITPKHRGRNIVNLDGYHIIAPCGSKINDNFFILNAEGDTIKEFDTLKHTVDYVINDLNIPLEDTLKLMRIKECIQ